MKGKYVTTQVLLACLSQSANQANKPARRREDIHVMLAMTIAERMRIMRKFKGSFFGFELDIHTMLESTIAVREEVIKRWRQAFLEEYELEERNAA
jgi:hypothetical protein